MNLFPAFYWCQLRVRFWICFKTIDEAFSRKETPPPITGMESENSSLKSGSNSNAFSGLQIKNPDVFGASQAVLQKQSGLSPTTPWDGQIEALER